MQAITAHAYAATGTPAQIAAAVAAIPVACTRYPAASRTAGDRRSATAAITGASTAAGTSCATATSPATVAPPRL